MIDLPNYNAAKRTEKDIDYTTVPGLTVDIGYAFGKDDKGDELKKQMDTLLEEMREDGTLDEVMETLRANCP